VLVYYNYYDLIDPLIFQSSGGVKREIPRPSLTGNRGDQFHNPGKRPIDVQLHDGRSEDPQPPRQHFQQRLPLRQNFNEQRVGVGQPPIPQRNEGLIDHLVPPGPPLPLDFERTRPSFDGKRRNNTSNSRYILISAVKA